MSVNILWEQHGHGSKGQRLPDFVMFSLLIIVFGRLSMSISDLGQSIYIYIHIVGLHTMEPICKFSVDFGPIKATFLQVH